MSTDGQTDIDGGTDMMKPIGAFRDFTNTPKNICKQNYIHEDANTR